MTGLTNTQVREARKKYGYNELPKTDTKKWYHMLLNQFKDTLIIILLIAVVISAFHNITEAIVIASIIVLNAGVGFFQEYRTERTLEALQKMINPKIRVLRDGRETMIDTRDLVPGDIVMLSEGDKVPADGDVIVAHTLRVEESAITGESVPVEKKVDDSILMGTAVVRGSAYYVVSSIGAETELGIIAKLTTTTRQGVSPLQKELKDIGTFVAKMAGIISVALLVIHVLRNIGENESLFELISEGFIFAISVAIAAVPEGLPTTVTVALALGATVLAKKKAIIKKLSSTETLGTVSTICTDKTGTLTKNQMTVTDVILSDGASYHITGVGYNPNEGEITGSNLNHSEFLRAADIAYYCNEAKLVRNQDGYEILGDPTEAALLTMAEKMYLAVGDSMTQYTAQKIFPFDSERKMMSVIAEDGEGTNRVFVKGSPDHVLEKCNYYYNGSKVTRLTEKKKKEIQESYNAMASKALRVLALAYKKARTEEMNQDEAESDLVYIGLAGMIDPPRAEVRNAIKKCNTAGIRTIVITGDYGVTASVIAEDLGIVEAENHIVISGAELKSISDESLRDMLSDKDRSIIFARSLPAQKMRIVEALQHNGEVVAMTGDGVNDAPALKRADIGVAMGITGTDVSKEAATLILLDDSFSTIVDAIHEGRRIYDNLKKFVLYVLSSNVGELVVIILSIIAGLPLILTAILILIINLGTDILPAIALGVDPAEAHIMKRKPRDPQTRVLNKQFYKRLFSIGLVLGLSVVAAFILVISLDGYRFGSDFSEIKLQHGQTVAFATLVIAQLFNSFSVKSKRRITWQHIIKNPFHITAFTISFGLVLAVTYVPFINTFLGTVPLLWQDWGIVAIASLLPVSIFEIQKSFTQKNT